MSHVQKQQTEAEMNREDASPERNGDDPEKGSSDTQISADVSQCGGVVDNDSNIMEKLLTANWGGTSGKGFTVEELLDIGRKALEPLFLV